MGGLEFGEMTARDESPMSAYEARAWKALMEQAQRPDSESGRYEEIFQGGQGATEECC